MSALDFEPGKYASEKEKWYFSCDTGDSVLVGIRERNVPNERAWTCPVLGMERREVTFEQQVELDTRSTVVWGDPDEGYSIRVLVRRKWNEIMEDDVPKDEWGNRTGNVVFVTTDADEVIRLHLSYE